MSVFAVNCMTQEEKTAVQPKVEHKTDDQARLYNGIKSGDLEEVAKALPSANVNAVYGYEKLTPLQLAAYRAPKTRRFKIMELLLQQGADINQLRDKTLSVAISRVDVELLKWLLKKGIEDEKGAHLRRAQEEAALHPDNLRLAKIVELLKSVQATESTQGPLRAAIRSGDLEAVKKALPQAKINSADSRGERPIQYAAIVAPKEKRLAIMDLLVERGADINDIVPGFFSLAIHENDVPMVAWFINKGIKDKTGHYLRDIQRRHADTAEWLKGIKGGQSEHYASKAKEEDYEKIVGLLKKAQA